jgi:dienelactone hydrolase
MHNGREEVSCQSTPKKPYNSVYDVCIFKVKVPTLFLLGAKDRRVPAVDPIQYVRALRARNLEVIVCKLIVILCKLNVISQV